MRCPGELEVFLLCTLWLNPSRQPRTLELEHFLGGIDAEVAEAGYEIPMMRVFDPKEPTKIMMKAPFRPPLDPTPSMPEVCLL